MIKGISSKFFSFRTGYGVPVVRMVEEVEEEIGVILKLNFRGGMRHEKI